MLYISYFADVAVSSNEENLTTMHNNAVQIDIPVKAVVNVTLTGFVCYHLSLSYKWQYLHHYTDNINCYISSIVHT